MATLFSWDCTSDVTSLGRVAGFFPGTSLVVRDGVPCMRLAVRGDDAGNQQMGVEQTFIEYGPVNARWPFVGGPALYYRWRMLIEPGFSWGAGTAKTKASRTAGGPIVNGSSQGQGYTGYVMSNGLLLGECDSAGCTVPGGGFNTDQNHLIPLDFRALADGRWREFVVKVKPNSAATVADAQFEAWMDNVFLGARNGFILHTNALHTLAEMWCGWMVTPYFQLNGTVSDGGVICVTDFSTDDAYNSKLGRQPKHNFDGVLLAEARKRVDPTMLRLVEQIDDCYYNGWRIGQSRPFFLWDYVAGQDNKLKFDMLSGILHHFTHLVQHLANCDHNGVNAAAAYPKYPERKYNQIIDTATNTVIETKVRQAKRWCRDMAVTWNNAGLTPVMNRTRFSQIVNHIKTRTAIQEILTRRPTLDPIFDIDNETDIT